MDYSNPKTEGRRAFLQGIQRNQNPCDYRTEANARALWDQGWFEQSKIECNGIEIEAGIFSGCTQTGGDCPTCGM